MNQVTSNAKGTSQIIERVIINPEIHAKHHVMNGVMKFVQANDRLCYLKDRWLDEREYEDFSEYRKQISAIFIEAGYKVIDVTKSFTITVRKKDDETGKMVEVEVKINAASIKARARINRIMGIYEKI